MSSKGRSEISDAAYETIKILKDGTYTATDPISKRDAVVDMKDILKTACDGTQCYAHNAPLRVPAAQYQTDVQVTKETTLQCASRLSKDFENGSIGILNFASAKHPGGGFQRGSWAQEETIATCSGLYACLTTPQAKVFYDAHDPKKNKKGGLSGGAKKPARRGLFGKGFRSSKAGAGSATATTKSSAAPESASANEPPYNIYTHNIVFAPNVPVFRNERNLELTTSMYTCNMISACAVNFNAGMFSKRKLTIEEKEFPLQTMQMRALRILQVAAHHKIDTLVLGAWGCGVFKNDPYDVAKMFKGALLHPDMEHAFRSIVFAIPDDPKSPETSLWFTKEFAKEKVDPRLKSAVNNLPRW